MAALGVFGSYARSEQRPGSDLDLLIDFDGPIGIFAYLSLEAELARRLGVPVELVSRPALKPVIGARILYELVAV